MCRRGSISSVGTGQDPALSARDGCGYRPTGSVARVRPICARRAPASREPLAGVLARPCHQQGARDRGRQLDPEQREQHGELHITLLFVPPGEQIVLPLTGWRFPDGAPEQEWRNYTVRRHDRVAGEIDVDVVLHEPRGPACVGAAQAPLGADVGYAGPRVDFSPREDAEWLLLCGDETALPAIAAILESPPTGAELIALVEVADGDEEQQLDLPPGARLEWVHRHGAPAATTAHLADALRSIDLPGGRGQAWGAAESRVARDLRTVLRSERGMPRSHASAKGYWLRSGEWLDDED